MNISTIIAAVSLLQKGQEVADPAKWKARQITGTALAGILMSGAAVAKTAGVEIPVDSESAVAIGSGVIAIWNIILTMATSKRAGV